MTTKPKAPPSTPKSRTLEVASTSKESRDVLLAKAAAGPYVGAASVITDYGRATWGELSLTELAHALKAQAVDVSSGDLSRPEAMLCAQAVALNTMFAELARRAACNMGEYTGAAEIYLKLALRAQNQCRSTLETLATIKNPPIFAKQANIAHGPQQVNNESVPVARAEQIKNAPTELLEHDHGQRLDTGTAATAGGGNQKMVTVEAVHRPANGGRQGRRQS
jgi:hypothetical protein